jgi:hypothetical protein
MLHSICEEIGSASLNSVTCHFCRRPAHLTIYFIPQICGFAICETYLRTAHLWLFLWRISYAELSSECSRWLCGVSPPPPPRKHRDSQSKIQFLYKGHIHEIFCLWIFHERVPPISVNSCLNTFYLKDIEIVSTLQSVFRLRG